MNKKIIPWCLVFILSAFVSFTSQGQTGGPTEAGEIKVAKVTGEVTAIGADGERVALSKGMEISQGYVVTTGENSSVILAFSNGATINLGKDSSLSIDEFLQDPFADEVSLAELTAEPSVSTTKLHLSRGELVGNVKKLNSDAGSSFEVQTPVGAAGIRGTTFRIVFRPDGTGRAFFSLTTIEGNVVLASGTMDLPAGISVTDNKEVEVLIDVEVDPDTGEITVTSAPTTPVTVTDTSPTTQADVVVAAQEIAEASAEIVFTTPASQGSQTGTGSGTGDSGTGNEGGDDQGGNEGGSESPPATPATPRTTTGDGK